MGTPAVIVTRSRTNRSTRFAGSSRGPGITTLAPIITAAYGRPQALAWNIGHDGERGVRLGHSQTRGQGDGERVQHEGPVRIEHALGLSGRAGGVAHRRGRALVRIGDRLERVGVSQEGLVLEIPGRNAASGAHDDRARDTGSRRHLFPERQQRLVHQHEAIVRIVDDEGDFVGMEPEVQCVQHAAGERDREIRLEVLEVIPPERGNAVAGADAKPVKGAGQAPDAAREVRVGVPVKRPVRPARHDLAAGMDLLRVTEDGRQRQRKVHHQAVHGPDCSPGWSPADTALRSPIVSVVGALS